jgi:hypothetical protein
MRSHCVPTALPVPVYIIVKVNKKCFFICSIGGYGEPAGPLVGGPQLAGPQLAGPQLAGPQIPPRSAAEGGQERVLSVSGEKKCSHCKEELGRLLLEVGTKPKK